MIIGLLCVQEDPQDRPTMPGVLCMLGTDIESLPDPKEPAFVSRKRVLSSISCIRACIVLCWINESSHSYGGDNRVGSLCHALECLYARVDKFNMILEELYFVIVSGGNVCKNHNGSYYGVTASQIGGIGSTSRSYRPLNNVKISIHYNVFSQDEVYVHFDDNSIDEINGSRNDNYVIVYMALFCQDIVCVFVLSIGSNMTGLGIVVRHWL
ncbi:hypothetical protein L1987_06198 [Smallanthus sonchifolius]|uniref:Uncharacterized protein n=1 Tax=Smallanthus sonchifolius TaxID=185202 RepID=A0ACB9JXG2_9ASTR|nr:hypothetical protein L1987_06198 [Smallanthus sonchifolius]